MIGVEEFVPVATTISAKDFGAKGDTKTVADAGITASASVLTSATAAFTAADVGKTAYISGAGQLTGITGTTHTTVTVDGMSSTAGVYVGQTVTGSGIAASTTVIAIPTSTSITLSQATSTSVVGTALTFTAQLATTISAFTNSTTVTVAATASNTVTNANLTYGTDDSTAVTNAVAAFNAATSGGVTGGILHFPAGNYICGGGYTLTGSGIVQGSGKGAAGFSTTLTLKAASNASMFTVGKLTTVKDLGIDGNYSGQTTTAHGIVVNNAYVILQNLYISNCRDDGINFTSANATGADVRGITIRTCQGNGINIGATCYDNDFYGVNVGTSGLNGVLVSAADNCFTQLHSWGNGTMTSGNNRAGLNIASGIGYCRFVNCNFETNSNEGARLTSTNRGVSFTGCEFWKNNGKGTYAFGCRNVNVTGCRFYNNGQSPAGTGSGQAGLVNENGTSWTVSGNQFFDDQGTKTQSYGYFEIGTTDFTVIIGNSIRAAELKTGSTTIVGAANLPTSANMATLNTVV